MPYKPSGPSLQERSALQAYRPDIDGLRAVAILSVVAFHAFPNSLQGGFIGVDVFFVISGFLISNIIFGGLRRGDFSFADFYGHRIKRIFPALIVVLAASYSFGAFILLPDEFKLLGKHTAAGAGFIENFVLWKEAGYFDAASELKPLMHLWSLGIEEQFYLVYPLLVWGAWQFRRNALLAVVLLGSLSFGLNVSEISSDAVWAFFAPQARFWELMAGSLLAYRQSFFSSLSIGGLTALAFRPPPRCLRATTHRCDSRAADLLSVLGFLAIAVAAAGIHKGMPFPGYWALVPVVGACLLILAGPEGWVNRKILANRAMIWVGVISYPLYLWHWPVLSFARIMESEIPTGEIRMAAVVLSFALAWLTYRLVERPIRFGGTTWIKTAGLATMLGFVGYIGYQAFERAGGGAGLLEIEQLQAEFDKRSIRPESATVMLLGDSHAAQLAPGLREALGQSLADYSATGCIPFYDVDRYDFRSKPEVCRRFVNSALELFENSDSMNTLILASMGPVYLTGKAFKGQGEARVTGLGLTLAGAPQLADRWEVFRTGMRDTLARLSAKNKKIIFVLDNPELGFDPNSCIDTQISARKLRNPCAVARREFDERNRDYRRLVAEVLKEFPQVEAFDMAAELCDKHWCWAIKNGKLLYHDFDHLSVDGSRYVVQALVPIVRGSKAERSPAAR